MSKDEVVVWESLLGGHVNSNHDVSLVTACFLPALQTLQVSKSSISGRPVYYCTNARGEFFASKHIAWLRRAGVSIEEDKDVLPELLVYRVVAPPRTLFRGIRQLRVSGSLVIDLKDGNLRVSDASRGYDPPGSPASEPEEESIRRVAVALQSAVARLAPVSPRVATLLSGGVDSSILSIIARDELSVRDTFSTAYPFDNPATNLEQEYALSAAAELGTRHSLFVPTAMDFLTGFVEGLAAAEAPLNHLQSVLLYLLFKSALPGHMDRIICGEAADSAFGLDTHFAFRPRDDLRGRLLSLPPVHLGLRALGSGWPRARAMAAHLEDFRSLHLPISDPFHPIWSYAAYGDFEWVRKNYGASREQVIASRSEQLQPVADRSFNDALALYALNYCDVALTTTIWSKLAEEQRKILYYPFASQDILDTAFSIPWEIKLKTGKHIVRGAGRRLGVPDFHFESPEAKFRHRFGPLGGSRRSNGAAGRPCRQGGGHKTTSRSAGQRPEQSHDVLEPAQLRGVDTAIREGGEQRGIAGGVSRQ